MRRLQAKVEVFAVRGAFVIARGARTEATVITVELSEGEARGRGECVPYSHYGESVESVLRQIDGTRAALEAGATRLELLELLPAGAARNGVDSALWDLEAGLGRTTVSALAGEREARTVRTMRTLSLDRPEAMAAQAARLTDFAVLKLKLGGEGDLDRVAAVHDAAPRAQLVVDANESWTRGQVAERLIALSALGVVLVEQPTPPREDGVLETFEHPVPICADEAFHTARDLGRIAGRYEVANIKLDKAGGLTHALAVRSALRERGLGVMVGCMLGTSLGMAPALLVAQDADFVDLDGPYLLAEDRQPGLPLSPDGTMAPEPRLWGGPA